MATRKTSLETEVELLEKLSLAPSDSDRVEEEVQATGLDSDSGHENSDCSTSGDDEETKNMANPFEFIDQDGKIPTYWRIDGKKCKIRFDRDKIDSILSKRDCVNAKKKTPKSVKKHKYSPKSPK
ncbi:hypothetical protein HDE_08463 [Halotydeus destructor]|nr:hypothetical protein HDE_08463 [Halotydeus destructor]